MSVAWIFLAVILGVAIGWTWAHSIVARECERLGSFYVGNKTYNCSKIDDRTFDPNDIPPRPRSSQQPPVRSPSE